MKNFLLLIALYCAGIGYTNAAVRDATTINRSGTTPATIARAASHQNTVQKQSPTPARGSAGVTQRTVRATATNPRTQTRTTQTPTTTPRQRQVNITTTRPQSVSQRITTARAGFDIFSMDKSAQNTETFGTGYTSCRDAYFTCMDQFCAKQNETYRRCICSSRLPEIQSRERALSQTADSLGSFVDLNIDVITKTKNEVTAMISASEGEAAIKKDTSDAAKQLDGISDVLSKTKKNALSTQGTMDIAGDINAIWATTELTSGANIANLTGEALYNAVHAQCAEIMTQYCNTPATQTMVISAYGMYIENDCSLMIDNLDKQLTKANSTIRETERQMHLARLENYNNHNSTSINDCVANVRTDITTDTACGTDFVHCLDVTGLYLNRTTGEPIYTPDFYQLEKQISLSGDILNNQSNRLVVAELEKMRKYAQNSLDKCDELADAVWDEFMRQTIREIYQSQQERIRDVKDTCLDVVNTCYDEQSKSLKDFTNVKDQLLIGQRLELSEEMCKEKLTACSNLYGDINLLVQAMHDIVNQQIANNCQKTLQEYVQELCAVTSNDTIHKYPYACRTYTPGGQIYASISKCNSNLRENNTGTSAKIRPKNISRTATGGQSQNDQNSDCGNYIGSLYQKIVRYATQACLRPSEANATTNNGDDDDNGIVLPTTVLADVNVVMDGVRSDMAKSLAAECERLGGLWQITTPTDTTDKNKKFYDETGANMDWGYCKEKEEEKEEESKETTQPTT